MRSLHFFLAGVGCQIPIHFDWADQQQRWRPESLRWPECAVDLRVVSMRKGPSPPEQVYPQQLAAFRTSLLSRTGNTRLPLIPFYFREIQGQTCLEIPALSRST